MADISGICYGNSMNTDLTQVAAYKPPQVGSVFDPTEEIALIRALAYNSMHGDEEATKELKEEIRRLHKTPFEAVIAMELAKPDRTKKLPVATYELDGNGPGIVSFNFHPGCLDFKAKAPILAIQVG